MAGSTEVFQDPLFQSLLSAYHKAARCHLAALVELRAYHLATPPAEADQWRSAVLAQAAEDTHHRLQDALAALNEYGWRLTPFGGSENHLLGIEAQVSFQKQREAGEGGWPPGRHPEGPEGRVGPFTIILATPPPTTLGASPETPPPE